MLLSVLYALLKMRLEHLFFHCSWTRFIWFGSNLSARMDVSTIMNFNQWWLNLIDPIINIDTIVLSQVCCTLWFIWKSRNGKVFEEKDPNPYEVLDLAANYNLQFWKVEPAVFLSYQRNEISSVVHWSKPLQGYLKINSDATFSLTSPHAFIGILCRDDYRNFRWGFCDKIKSISAFMSEVLALKRALMLAVDLGHDKVCFESDSKYLIESIQANRPDMYDWRCRSIIQDILNLMTSNVGFSVTIILRIGNAAADCIAAEACKGVYPSGWVSQPTLLLNSILMEDARIFDDVPQDASNSTRLGVG